jgi:hypothetical protein
MLDHPEKTARLLTALMSAVPFEVELPERLVKYLRAKDIVMTARQTVSSVSYAGDEGGIMCHTLPAEAAGALVVSLTHVRAPRSMPLGAAIADYQRHRLKKLKKQGRG